MKNKKLSIFDAGVVFLLSFALSQITSIIGILIVQGILSTYGKTATQIEAFFDTAYGYLLQAIFMNIAFVLIFIYYYKRIGKSNLLSKPNTSTIKYVVRCVAIGVVSLFLLSGTLNYFQMLVDKLGFSAGTLPFEIDSPAKYIVSFISLAVIPAVCEELIFRGVIVNCLKSKGKIFAIMLSSVMFAMFHFSPSQLIYPFCFGLILSIVYLRTSNILFPILLHFINNALSLSIQYFSTSTGEVFTHSISILIYSLITLIIWIAIILYLFKDFKNHNSKLNDETTETEDDETPVENNAEKEKKNNYMFYGSLIIMSILYLILIHL